MLKVDKEKNTGKPLEYCMRKKHFNCNKDNSQGSVNGLILSFILQEIWHLSYVSP